MVWFATLAFVAGLLVSLSRQLNGSLSLSTSALHSSVWNHIVGLVFITVLAVLAGGLFAGTPTEAPRFAYFGGPIGVVFIAASSWAITKIGAAQTAMLIIAGQMIFGVLLDIVLGASGNMTARIVGVSLILAGMWLARSVPPAKTSFR
jgi:transporter family-2 protein